MRGKLVKVVISFAHKHFELVYNFCLTNTASNFAEYISNHGEKIQGKETLKKTK